MQWFLTWYNLSLLLADKTSLAPCLERFNAMCSPIPLEAPVIQTTLSLNESIVKLKIDDMLE